MTDRIVTTSLLSPGFAIAIAIAMLALLPPSAPAAAQSIADTFRGKTVRILVPSVPGGDRALYPLTFAGYFAKHIPGNPTVLPVFMPGAGGSAAVNNAYGVAAPDGLTLVTPLVAVITAQALGDESVKYDVAKLAWIGRIADATRVLLVSGKVGAGNLAELRGREVVIGAVARASETYLIPAFINKMFGTRFKIVTGYQAAGKVNMAIESGETEAAITTWNDVSNYHADWLRDDKMRLILQIALEKHPDLADVPLLLDLAANQADRDLIAFMSSGSQMGQSYAAPPGVPAPIVEALRRAFDDTMKDPAFIEKMQTAKMAFNPMSGEELTRFVARTIGAPAAVIERYKAAVAGD
jgi:tripartite-type tricarboxylate transporter receptor subunit TctC